MSKKVLILYTNYGTGHYMAAKAILEYILDNYSNYEVELLDPLTFSRPIINKFFAKFGKVFATKFRRIRGKFYKYIMYNNYIKNVWYYKSCISLFWTKKLKDKITGFDPDIIISTQVGPTCLIAYYKHLFNAKLISAFTDYGIHRMYTVVHEYIDMYCVPTEEIKEKMINLGINKNKINVTGIPVCKKFLIMNDYNKNDLIKKYKLLKNKPIILFICGGGLGYDNAFIYFKELLRSEYEFSYIFISGKNNKLYSKAQKLASQYNKVGKIFCYVDDIDKYMKCSDLIIGKPGGIITSESLNLSVPLCAVEPIPGQEINNSLFIANNKFGFYIKNISEFHEFLHNVMNKNINLDKYSKNINKKFKKFSFLDIDKI